MERWTKAVAETIRQNEADPCARWMRTARAATRLCQVRPELLQTLLAGWVAADQEVTAGSAAEDALRVGRSVIERLRHAEEGDRDPFTIACRHLWNCAAVDYQEAEYYARRRVHPQRGRRYVAR